MLKMRRKPFIVALSIAIIVATFVLVVDKTHPVILKWLSGSAKIIGKPIDAKIYTDGILNPDMTVYKVNSYWNGRLANNYLLCLKAFDKAGMLKYINIDLKEKWVGRPVGTSEDDYDVINGYLFQSETGGHFIDFKDDMKGFAFDPELHYDGRQIKFQLPPNVLKFSSIAVDLH